MECGRKPLPRPAAGRATAPRARRRVRQRIEATEQAARPDPEGLRHADDGDDARVPLALLDTVEERPVEVAPEGQALLRDPRALARPAERLPQPSEDVARIHARQMLHARGLAGCRRSPTISRTGRPEPRARRSALGRAGIAGEAQMGFAERVMDVVEGWKPGWQDSEKDYERSLEDCLARNFADDVTVEPQWAHQGLRFDLFVARTGGILGIGGGKIWIELKRNLSSTGEYQRLVGQTEQLVASRGDCILLVICGENDAKLMERLERWAADRNRRDDGARIEVIEKRTTER